MVRLGDHRQADQQSILLLETSEIMAIGMKAELDSLSKSQPQIETVICAVESGRLRGADNPGLEGWLGQLRDAVEEADNVFDELEYQNLKEKADEGKGKSMKMIGKFAVRAVQHDDVLKRLRAVVKTFDKLVAGNGTFVQVVSWLEEHIASEVRGDMGRETDSSFSENELFGWEREKQTIIHWLNNSDKKIISVFSIIGVAGVGKTALVQDIFNHPGMDFEIKMWVCVSTPFKEKAIIMKMLESVKTAKHEFFTLDAAQRTLKENIRDKKFLLVLDDVWNDKEGQRWNKVMSLLKYGSQGSKILLTTRMESVADTVANIVGETKMSLKLNSLGESDNVLLFEKYAFAGYDQNEYPRLQSIGDKIARKLMGIPLVVKSICGMLNMNMEDKYWSSILEDGVLNFDKEMNDILASIRLSYEHLPSELKPCFRYCSIFSQDHKFDKQKLMDMWISVGLIPEGKKRQEELASEYFETLVQKSFFEPNGSFYSMHYLLHKLAQILSKNECLRVVSNDPIQIPKSIRHLSLGTSNLLVLRNLPELKYLRTLLLLCDIQDVELACVIDTALKGFKNIRWLKLSSTWLCDFPKCIGDLVHLRYLSTTETKIPNLSPSVCMLYHLELLEFKRDDSHDHIYWTMPDKIYKLSKLKRLYLPVDNISTIAPIGKLSSLLQLKRDGVKGEVRYDISELEMMSELRELKITNLENVKSTKAASKAQLNSKQHLFHIELMWSDSLENGVSRNESDKKIADCLQPHRNLTELLFKGYRGTNLPYWLRSECLPFLNKITLAHCSSLERLPPFGQLLYLKFLILEDMGALKEIGLEFYGFSKSGNTFPALETLELRNLIQLELWREDTQSEIWFPRLKRLVVSKCPSLKELPPIPSALKELELNVIETTTFPRFKQMNKASSTNQRPWSLSSLLITGCSKLTSLSSGFFMHPEQLASLEKLEIRDCVELVHLPSEGFRGLISLKSLLIEQCRNLFLLPLLLPKNFFPPSVQWVVLGSCGDLALCLPQILLDLSLISILNLMDCANLISLPAADAMQSLISLRKLEIQNCERLKSLGGLEAIPSLKVLLIKACPILAATSEPDLAEELPRNRLSMALDKLYIDDAGLLLVVPLRNLYLTKSLELNGSHGIMVLPEQWLLQNRASLQSLVLSDSTLLSVETLPDIMQSLLSLRNLVLHNAFKLKMLPELPRSLEILDIDGCSEELAGRLKEGGLDFDKIRHLEVSVSRVSSQSRISQIC